MTDIARLFQAFLAPAIFVSATALLILSINVRLMGIVSRLRQYVHAKHDAAKNNRAQEAEAYTAQINVLSNLAEETPNLYSQRGVVVAVDNLAHANLSSKFFRQGKCVKGQQELVMFAKLIRERKSDR